MAQEPLVTKDITYSTPAEGVEMKLDFYKPVTASDGPTPLVVVLHGGAWITGKRQDMAAACETLSRQGLAAATISYRLAPRFKWPAMVDDAQAAVRYLKANAQKYNIDPKRVGAVGASAGAHLALLLGSMDSRDPKLEPFPDQSSRVFAVVNLFGPTDLAADFNPALAGIISASVLGKKIDEATEDIKAFSPVSHVAKGMAPVFTIHGTLDNVVPVRQATRLDEALDKAGVEHELRIIEGMGHELPVAKPEVAKAFTEALDFLRRHLFPVKR